MKKLFFTALVAIVAVGGAISTQAAGIYYTASGQEINCTSGTILCSATYGTLYDSYPNGNEVDLDSTDKHQ